MTTPPVVPLHSGLYRPALRLVAIRATSAVGHVVHAGMDAGRLARTFTLVEV